MTDKNNRAFVSVSFDAKKHSFEAVQQQLEECLSSFPFKTEITAGKPPRIITFEEISIRYAKLLVVAQSFRDAYSARFSIPMEIDPRLLFVATISAYDDIERYKAYHLETPYSTRSNGVKRAAYLTKWLARFRPFQSVFDPKKSDLESLMKPELITPRIALANIKFSISVAEYTLGFECKKHIKLTPEAEYQLTYDLLYRRITEDALLAKYQMILDIADEQPLLV